MNMPMRNASVIASAPCAVARPETLGMTATAMRPPVRATALFTPLAVLTHGVVDAAHHRRGERCDEHHEAEAEQQRAGQHVDDPVGVAVDPREQQHPGREEQRADDELRAGADARSRARPTSRTRSA